MIRLENISKYYYSDTSVTLALRKINLRFSKGEFVAVTGESGSGKSTLLNLISGMDTFDEGELYLYGQEAFAFDDVDWEKFRRDKIGFVFQDYSLIGQYSALENIVGALVIMGVPKEEAEETAKEYLAKVGLSDYAGQKASQLSSGQKQRLSIARALAKKSPIIIADEPTGNLDSETGEQIIRLLKELSEDRLVIMVTHNYEQAAPYVTRKICLHDGEVVVDVPVNQDATQRKASETTEESPCSTDVVSDASSEDSLEQREPFTKKQIRKIACYFARRNATSQIRLAMLFRVFFLFTAIVSFIFIGELFANADDTSTKDYEKEIYYQKNDSRLSVQRKDGKDLSQKDIDTIASVRNVVQVDPYDSVNDFNYYIEKDKDYDYHYSVQDTEVYFSSSEGVESELASEEKPNFLKKNKFMRSSACITKEDLKEGRLPKKRSEIVISASQGYALDEKAKIYITASNVWGDGNYYVRDFMVVGILKEDTTQVYFAPDFCQMLAAGLDGDQFTLSYYFDRQANKYLGKDSFYLVIDETLSDIESDEAESALKEQVSGGALNATAAATIDQEQGIVRAKISRNYITPEMGYQMSLPVEGAVPGMDTMTVKINENRPNTPEGLNDLENITLAVEVLGMGETEEETEANFNNHSGCFLEVSEATFQKLVPRGTMQAAVYIKNYTKTDAVIGKLEKLGYHAISTYRVASVTYNDTKVMNRLIFIGISVGILLLLIFLEILLLRSLMGLRKKEFSLLRSLGMPAPVIKRVSIYEMTRYCVEAILLTLLVMCILNGIGIKVIHLFFIYYSAIPILLFIIYNIILALTTVRSFNRLLERKEA